MIIDFQHVKPGKGGAFVRTKLKSCTNGKIIQKTFNAGSRVQTARVERRSFQFLYKDHDNYHFMDQLSFEQLVLKASLINAPNLLKEGATAFITLHAETEQPLACELPPSVALTVTYTEPGYRGNTATRALKPATLETGAQVQVPLFIAIGDLIKVKVDAKTGAGTYEERLSAST